MNFKFDNWLIVSWSLINPLSNKDMDRANALFYNMQQILNCYNFVWIFEYLNFLIKF